MGTEIHIIYENKNILIFKIQSKLQIIFIFCIQIIVQFVQLTLYHFF